MKTVSPLTPEEIGAFKVAAGLLLQRRVNVRHATCEYRGDSRWPDSPATAVHVFDGKSPLRINLSAFEIAFLAFNGYRHGPTILIPTDEPGPWWAHARDLLQRIQAALDLPEATANEKRAEAVAKLHEIFHTNEHQGANE